MQWLIGEIEAAGDQCILLTSDQRAFCAGANLKEGGRFDPGWFERLPVFVGQDVCLAALPSRPDHRLHQWPCHRRWCRVGAFL